MRVPIAAGNGHTDPPNGGMTSPYGDVEAGDAAPPELPSGVPLRRSRPLVVRFPSVPRSVHPVFRGAR